MVPVVFFAPVLGAFSTVLVLVWVLFCFLGRLGNQILVELPQFELQLFERVTIGLVLRVALQVAAPPVSVLHDDVFCGTHEGKYSWTFQMRK